ncbi:glycoside hydrolase family 16 protein [Micromonospora sp. NBS 11-29]|uniref:glycoside hydrolase family 16 protein n=1 Tax=Micromonospora sp. NBS 11-29 TaxID=1960879 RepID=UPI000B779E8B|nr:glycoside hydrolase family 16 protein [Micromonospora sp. NBS 11-29]
MRSFRTVAALATAAIGLTAALTTVPSTPAVAAPGAVTWSDDFNGPAGAAPDASKWRYDIGGSGWGNNELQYYTNSTRNAALDGNGNLVITARKENPGGYGCWYGSCQYTSARLLTNGTFAQAYGRFEARIKIPRGQGLWPAFWMLGNDIGSNPWPNSGEIDIMENVGSSPSTVWGTLHGPGYSGGNGIGASTSLPNGQALADAFHTFAVDWAPDSITWYLDGVAYSRKTPADAGGNRWVFDHPFFMIMNVAVGGNWPGSPNSATTFPQTMTIDYVRVQAWDNGGGGTGGQIVGYGNKCIDVASASTANGTAVQLWTCNGTAAQRWTWNADGSVRALGKCLDVASGSTANGAKVQLYDCNGSGAQKWVFSSAGDIVNPQANKCLDATGNSSADGTRLQIWECGGTANQKWRR